MNPELEIAEIFRADATIMTLLTGGVYTDEEIGVEGIRRSLEVEDTNPTKDAFDENGYLLPCAVVRQRGETPYGGIYLPADGITAMSQTVQIFFYQFRGSIVISAARERAYTLLFNTQLSEGWPLMVGPQSPSFPDVGPVQNSTVMIQDWMVVFLKRAVPA